MGAESVGRESRVGCRGGGALVEGGCARRSVGALGGARRSGGALVGGIRGSFRWSMSMMHVSPPVWCCYWCRVGTGGVASPVGYCDTWSAGDRGW